MLAYEKISNVYGNRLCMVLYFFLRSLPLDKHVKVKPVRPDLKELENNSIYSKITDSRMYSVF